MSKTCILLGAALVLACNGEDDGSGGSATNDSNPCGDFAPCTTGVTATGGNTETDDGTATSGATSTGSSVTAASGGSDSGSGSEGTAGACPNRVPGGWNRCIDEMGDIDNTQCMWMGTGDSIGIVGCLTSSMMPEANVCFIEGCETVCDCFAPPTTGTAEVVCDAILAGGGMGCGLDCTGGKTCPDGMDCLGNLCFWPPIP